MPTSPNNIIACVFQISCVEVRSGCIAMLREFFLSFVYFPATPSLSSVTGQSVACVVQHKGAEVVRCNMDVCMNGAPVLAQLSC